MKNVKFLSAVVLLASLNMAHASTPRSTSRSTDSMDTMDQTLYVALHTWTLEALNKTYTTTREFNLTPAYLGSGEEIVFNKINPKSSLSEHLANIKTEMERMSNIVAEIARPILEGSPAGDNDNMRMNNHNDAYAILLGQYVAISDYLLDNMRVFFNPTSSPLPDSTSSSTAQTTKPKKALRKVQRAARLIGRAARVASAAAANPKKG